MKELTEPKGEIAEANGFNCTQRNPVCPTNKVGVITMRRHAEDDSGEPIPLYVNLVFDSAKPLDRAVRRHGSDHPGAASTSRPSPPT